MPNLIKTENQVNSGVLKSFFDNFIHLSTEFNDFSGSDKIFKSFKLLERKFRKQQINADPRKKRKNPTKRHSDEQTLSNQTAKKPRPSQDCHDLDEITINRTTLKKKTKKKRKSQKKSMAANAKHSSHSFTDDKKKLITPDNVNSNPNETKTSCNILKLTKPFMPIQQTPDLPSEVLNTKIVSTAKVPIVKKLINAIELKIKKTVALTNKKNIVPKVLSSTIEHHKKKVSVSKCEQKRKSLNKVKALTSAIQLSGENIAHEIKVNYVALNDSKVCNSLKKSLETKKPALKVMPPKTVNTTCIINRTKAVNKYDNLQIDQDKMRIIREQRFKKIAASAKTRYGSTSTVSSSASSFQTVNSSFCPSTHQKKAPSSKPRIVNDLTLTISSKSNNTTIMAQNKSTIAKSGIRKVEVKNHNQVKPTWNCGSSSKTPKKNVILYPRVKFAETTSTKTTKSTQYQNYRISDLDSDDETDDEEMPSKPIPHWATNDTLMHTASLQSVKYFNFTSLFRATLKENVNLEEIFKVKKAHFPLRTSSANWNDSPPVWK
jgi:glycerol-3-phosphate cytidylyltransferase-like family protein